MKSTETENTNPDMENGTEIELNTHQTRSRTANNMQKEDAEDKNQPATNKTENISDNQTENLEDNRCKTRSQTKPEGRNNVQKSDKAKPKNSKPKTKDTKVELKPKVQPKENNVRKNSVITANKIVQNIKGKWKGSWSAVTRSRKKEKVLTTQYHCTKKGCVVVKCTKSAIMKHISECDNSFRF